MIKVYFDPQRSDRQIEYSFCGEVVTVKIGEVEDTFDFSILPDGELDRLDEEKRIETLLPVCPIVSAKRVDGTLHLKLLNWIGRDAPYESRFPKWVELPLPESIAEKEKEPLHKAIIPWRTKVEIDAAKAARQAEAQERDDRLVRIKDGLSKAKTTEELINLLKDMAAEMGMLE